MINISSIPGSIRKPGAYIDFDTSAANRGVPANKQRMLIIAQRLAAGTVSAGVPTQVFSDEEAATFFGRGSQCHIMARAAFRANLYCDLTICALDDNGAGVAATGTVTMTGPATAAGVLTLFVGDVKVEASVASGDTATAIAASLNSVLGKLPNLPVTATSALGVVTLTARNKGTCGNAIGLGYELTNAAGVAVALSAMANGSADPLLDPAVAAVSPVRFHNVAVPYTGTTELTAVRDYLAAVSGPIEQKPGAAFVAMTGSLASSTTLSAALNAARVMPSYLRYGATKRKTIPWEIAARIAARFNWIEDPAHPMDYEELHEVSAPDVAERLTRAEQESLLWNGVTPLAVGPGDTVQIVRAISSYTKNGAGVDDPSLLDVTTIRCLDYTRQAIRDRILLRFKGAKLVAKTPARVKDQILDVLYTLEGMEIVRNVDDWKGQLVVEEDARVAGRINAKIPAQIVQGLHVFAAVIELHI
jgi:phage tail sheath gpL-like